MEVHFCLAQSFCGVQARDEFEEAKSQGAGDSALQSLESVELDPEIPSQMHPE